MLVRGVFSEDMHFTDMMLLPKRRNQARPATAGLSCAFAVAASDRKRTRKGKRRKRRSQSTGRHQSKYMLLKQLKKELKVTFMLLKNNSSCRLCTDQVEVKRLTYVTALQ